MNKTTNVDTIPSSAQGNRVIKMEDKEVQSSRIEKSLDGHLKKKISEDVCRTNSVISLPEGSSNVQPHVDVNLNYERPTVTVYSADEIPKKNRGASSQLVKSKEATEYNPNVESGVLSHNATTGALSEQSVQTDSISKGRHLSMKEATIKDQSESFSRSYNRRPLENVNSSTRYGISSPQNEGDLGSSMHNPCSALQNKFPLQTDSGGKGSSCPSAISICSPSSNKPIDEKSGNMLHPQNTSASQFSRHKGNQEDQGKSFPYTVSALITSSTAIIAETDGAQQQRNEVQSMVNSELSLRFGSSLQRLSLGKHN